MHALLSVLFVLTVVAPWSACGDSTVAVPTTPDGAVVVRIVDGDTLRARLPRGEETIRLIGIDTPESVRPGTPVQCFAREASRRLGTLVPRGTELRLERDVEARDRYGRLLAYVFRRRDDLFVNLALAEEGFARVATYPPNVAYADRFVAGVADARTTVRGLWSRCPVSPSRDTT